MKLILLVGGVWHCHSCIDVIEASGVYEIEGVIQPKKSFELISGYPIIGTDDDLPKMLNNTKSALITVGQVKKSEIRIRLFNLLKELSAFFLLNFRLSCQE